VDQRRPRAFTDAQMARDDSAALGQTMRVTAFHGQSGMVRGAYQGLRKQADSLATDSGHIDVE
jgi:hypothetical protein